MPFTAMYVCKMNERKFVIYMYFKQITSNLKRYYLIHNSFVGLYLAMLLKNN